MSISRLTRLFSDLASYPRTERKIGYVCRWCGWIFPSRTTEAAEYFLVYLFLIPTPSPKAVPTSVCEETGAWRNSQTSLTSNNYCTVSGTQEQVRGTPGVKKRHSRPFIYFLFPHPVIIFLKVPHMSSTH